MLFSILIPTYNNCDTIEKAVKSALEQHYSDEYEVIVVNNASTDNTIQVLSKIKDNKLHVYTNISTVNLYSNHNIALQYAKGDYVIYCHADDTLLPHCLQVFASHLRMNDFPKRYIALGHSYFRDYTVAFQDCDHLLTYNMMFSGITAKKVFMSSGTTPSGTCYSRESFIEIGGFDDTDGAFESDWFAFLYAAFHGFEFEIIDRMLFKRECASTYIASNNERILEQRVLSMQRFVAKLTNCQKEELCDLYRKYEYVVWKEMFPTSLPTKVERLNQLMVRYKKSPWCIWKLIKWLLIKINIWK